MSLGFGTQPTTHSILYIQVQDCWQCGSWYVPNPTNWYICNNEMNLSVNRGHRINSKVISTDLIFKWKSITIKTLCSMDREANENWTQCYQFEITAMRQTHTVYSCFFLLSYVFVRSRWVVSGEKLYVYVSSGNLSR